MTRSLLENNAEFRSSKMRHTFLCAVCFKLLPLTKQLLLMLKLDIDPRNPVSGLISNISSCTDKHK